MGRRGTLRALRERSACWGACAGTGHLLEVRGIPTGLREAAIARALRGAGGSPEARCELRWTGEGAAVAVFETGAMLPRVCNVR